MGVETVFNQALAAWRNGEIDDQEVLRRLGDGDDARTHHARGWVHRERGGHAAADEAFTRALLDGRYGCDPAVWAACGDARRACERFAEAAAAYRRALALAPRDQQLAWRLARAERRVRDEVATVMAGAIGADKPAGALFDCVPMGRRHAAVVRRGPGADGWVSLHLLPETWDGGDRMIHDQPGRWAAAAPGGDRILIGGCGDTTGYTLDGEAVTWPPMAGAAWIDDDRFVAAFDGGRFALMAARAGQPLDEWHLPAAVNGVDFLPGGRFAVCAGASAVELVDLRARRSLLRWPLAAGVPEIAVRDDGACAAVLAGGTLSMWDVPRRRCLAERPAPGRRGVRFWPDGDHLLTGGDHVELWDVATGRRRRLAGLRGRLVVHGEHGFLVPDDEPEQTARLVVRVRLGTLPPASPELAPPPGLPAHLLVMPPAGAPRVQPLGARTTIGWHDACDLALRDDHVSEQHCRVTREAGGFVLRDLGSTRGTVVNDRILRAPDHVLATGDIIRLGDHRLIFTAD